MLSRSKYTVLILLFFFCANLVAQRDEIVVSGSILDGKENLKLSGCSIQILKDGAIAESVNTAASNKYNLKLSFGFIYDIKVTKDGYLQKIFRLNTRNIPEEFRSDVFEVTIDGDLMKSIDGFNPEILQQPVASIYYDSGKNEFVSDSDFFEKRKKEIDDEVNRIKWMKENPDQYEDQFKSLVKEGDEYVAGNQLKEARAPYLKALSMHAKDPDLILKLKNLDALLADQEKNELALKRFSEFVALGNKDVHEGKLESGRSNYQRALKLFDDIPLKEKLYDLNLRIQRAEDERLYTDFLSKGDNALKSGEYLSAIDQYTKALDFDFATDYPGDQIEKVKLAMASPSGADDVAVMVPVENVDLVIEDEPVESLKQEPISALIDIADLPNSHGSDWQSNVDIEAERRVDRFFRDAIIQDYASNAQQVMLEIENAIGWLHGCAVESDLNLETRMEHLEVFKNQMDELVLSWKRTFYTSSLDRGKKKKGQKNDGTEGKSVADTRIKDNQQEIDEKRQSQQSIQQNDRIRTMSIERNKEKKEQAAENQKNYERKGNTNRVASKISKEQQKQKMAELEEHGERERLRNQDEVNDRVKEEKLKDDDERKAADQRITNKSMLIERKKEDQNAPNESGVMNSIENANEIKAKKQEIQYDNKQREMKSSNQRFQSRKELFGKKATEPKTEEEYLISAESENLKEGVTENSYKLGNKIVIERIVRIGNKVDYYKKVVSKSGTYFFKNEKSITEGAWKTETLK